MSDPVTISISGIKCDTDQCGYRDDNVDVNDYEQYVDKPCPKCGAPLLTEADYEAVQLMIEMTEEFNVIGKALGLDEDDDQKRVKLELSMNGSGTVKVKDDEQ